MRAAPWVAAALAALTAAAAARGAELTLEGTPVEGGLMHGAAPPGARVWLDGAPVPVAADGRFAFGFHRDAAPQAELRVVFADGSEDVRRLDVAQRDYDIQRIDGLPPSTVTPSPEELARIEREQALIEAARDTVIEAAHYAEGFIWPAVGRVSGVYGSQRILNGEPRRPHFGIDIAAPAGAPVVAPTGGVVTLTHPGMFFSGKTVILDHGMGISSVFIHLSEILVEDGQEVAQGELIARIGKTGRATGPHLHWGLNWGREIRLDPELLLGPMPK